MKVEIFDVNHGSCALVTTTDGRHILLDCGSSSGSLLTSWYPGQALAARGIRFLDELVISHADKDHVSGLQSILDAQIRIGWIETNRSLIPESIRALKPEPPGPEVELFLELLGRQSELSLTRGLLSPPPPMPPAYTSIRKNDCRCTYVPEGQIKDLNNLSLVTFLFCGGLRMVFPGDLEELGWQRLLANDDFTTLLNQVNIFVASHHGRRNGYCADVFCACRPDIVVFSDSSISQETQDTAGIYRNHTSGTMLSDKVQRHVLTTRNDGQITFAATKDSFDVTIRRA